MLTFNPARHMRLNTLDFKEPKPNGLIQNVFKLLLPWMCKKPLNHLTVELDSTSLKRLRDIKGQRCLLLPNHPSEWDPIVLFDVGRQLKENFFFVAAREVFDYSYGLRGWFFQRLGVYSLVRGSQDRASFKTSIDILSQNKGRLVIFAEGEISNQNEKLLPLEGGVIQLAMMALNDVYKENGKILDSLSSLYICPVGLRYMYKDAKLDGEIHKSIESLEEAVGISQSASSSLEAVVPTNPDHYHRLMVISSAVLKGTAAQLGVALQADASRAQNVHHLCNLMLEKLEHVLSLKPDAALTNLNRIRRIRNRVDKVLSQTIDEHSSHYARRLFAHQKSILKHFYEDLERVVNFIAIYDGALSPEADDSNTVELIRRLEREVFGQYRLAPPRRARVVVSEPIDLKNHFDGFLSDKKATLATLAAQVEQSLFRAIHHEP